MANNKLLVDERQADIGGFLVGRLLPFRKKRQVGPFTFIDHMGPTQRGNGTYAAVDRRPQLGLSTRTSRFEGEVERRDGVGRVQVIGPGDVGFMTSGRGVTHTERTPSHLRSSETFTMHGYQIWVALPKEKAEMEPRFDYFASHEIPAWEEDGVKYKLAAGQAFGRSAPLQGFSPLFMVDIYTEKATTIDLGNQLKGEVAFVIVNGAITDQGEEVHAGQMLISKTNEACQIHLADNTQLLLFGGEPLEDEVYMMWNFVAHDKARLQQAKQDWDNKNFPKVPGDDTYIPFPTRK